MSEIEQLVFHDRTTKCRSELVAANDASLAGPIKVVTGVQLVVLQKLVSRSMEFIGPALRHDLKLGIRVARDLRRGGARNEPQDFPHRSRSRAPQVHSGVPEPARQDCDVPAAGDRAVEEAAYQDFFTLWKDADPEIPILKQANTEFANLR